MDQYENALSQAIGQLDDDRARQAALLLVNFALTKVAMVNPHLTKEVVRARQFLRKQVKRIPEKPTSKPEAECLLILYTSCFNLESETKRGEKCIEYAEKSHDLVRKNLKFFSDDMLPQVQMNLGLAFKRAGKFKKAERVYLKNIQEVEKNPPQPTLTRILMPTVRVRIYGLKSERGQAMNGQRGKVQSLLANGRWLVRTAYESISLKSANLEVLQDCPETVHCLYNNIAALYATMKKWRESEKWYRKCLDRGRKSGDWLAVAHTCENFVGYLLREKERYEEAVPLMEECVGIRKNHDPEFKDLMNGLGNLALAYESAGLNDKAEALFMEYFETGEKERRMIHGPFTTRRYGYACFLESLGRIDDAVTACEAGIAFNVDRNNVYSEPKVHKLLHEKMLSLKRKTKTHFKSTFDDGFGESWKQSVKIHPEIKVPEKCTPKSREFMKEMKRLANSGNPQAYYQLGMGYFKGRGGLKIDNKEAVKWFKKAGDKGIYLGYHSLGLILLEGRIGVPADPKEARRYFHLGADQGKCPECSEALGKLYEFATHDTQMDFELARKYYDIATNRPNAKNEWLCEFGSFLQQKYVDTDAAIEVFERCIKENPRNADALFHLGQMYMQMEGKEMRGRKMLDKILYGDVAVDNPECNPGRLGMLQERTKKFLKDMNKESKQSIRSVCGYCQKESKAEFALCEACELVAYCSSNWWPTVG